MSMLPTHQPASSAKRLRPKKLKKFTAFIRASFSSRRRITISPLPVLPTHQTSSTKRLHRTKLAAFRVSLSNRRRIRKPETTPSVPVDIQDDLELIQQTTNQKQSFRLVARPEKQDDIGNYDLAESQYYLGLHDGSRRVQTILVDEVTHVERVTDSKSAHTSKKKWFQRLRKWWKSPSTIVDDPLAPIPLEASTNIHNFHTKSFQVENINGKYAECDKRKIHTNVEHAGMYNEASFKVENGHLSTLYIGNDGHCTVNYYAIVKGRPTMFYPVLVFMILSFYMQQEARGLSFR
ncbi:hypothetical protein K435DRAFT_971429 [Dendrothele bispora CBS 962.96]|uniref:Uncharacterized protein n=1 Tax=Dendrothele bispora (strain CBS 962.96) TaxID=1314807 RepID=A0A4S8L5D7_DENBC|nr:hypothetical protein K435DRAFT_971429 [Dendrothele bispora CBS 962.96]